MNTDNGEPYKAGWRRARMIQIFWKGYNDCMDTRYDQNLAFYFYGTKLFTKSCMTWMHLWSLWSIERCAKCFVKNKNVSYVSPYFKLNFKILFRTSWNYFERQKEVTNETASNNTKSHLLLYNFSEISQQMNI